MKSFLSMFSSLLAACLCVLALLLFSFLLSGCSAPTWKGVPVETLKPISHQEFSGGGVEVVVTMYAKDVFYITARNTLENYRFKEIPQVSSPTGRIAFPTSKDANEIGFNYSPKSASSIANEQQDIVIPWTVEETGDKGFLITHKVITFDITGKPGAYFINSIRVAAVADDK